MGSAIFGDTTGSMGQVASGTALKRLMISPLAKTNRIRMRADSAIKKAFYLCSELGGKDVINLNNADISITWQDGIPADATEEALIIDKRTGGKATMSQKRALMQFDGMAEDDAEEELERIQDEEAMNNPIGEIPFAGGTESTPTDITVPAATKQSLNGAQMQSFVQDARF